MLSDSGGHLDLSPTRCMNVPCLETQNQREGSTSALLPDFPNNLQKLYTHTRSHLGQGSLQPGQSNCWPAHLPSSITLFTCKLCTLRGSWVCTALNHPGISSLGGSDAMGMSRAPGLHFQRTPSARPPPPQLLAQDHTPSSPA